MQGRCTAPANFLPDFVYSGENCIFGLCKAKMQSLFLSDSVERTRKIRKPKTLLRDLTVDKPVETVNNFLYAPGFPQLLETKSPTIGVKIGNGCKFL